MPLSATSRLARVLGAEKPATPAPIWGATLLLGLYAALRLHALLRFPPFIDELEYLELGRQIRQGHVLVGAANGKLFGLWWIAPSTFGQNGQLFTARALTVLLTLIGAALLYRVTHHFAGIQGSIPALLIASVAPYLLFYDRMIITDLSVSVWGMAALWFAARHAQNKRLADALLCGISLWLALLGKATGIFLVVIPFLAYVLLMYTSSRREYRQQLLRSLAATVTLYAVLASVTLGLVRWRGYNYFSTATTVVGSEKVSGPQAYLDHWRALLEIDRSYFGWPLLALWAAAWLVYLRTQPRKALFWAGVTFAPVGGLLLFGEKMSARYFLFHVPLLIAGGTIALVESVRTFRRHHAGLTRAVLTGVVALWAAAVAWPFYAQYLRDPANLKLPPLDRLEYISSDAAGFGLAEVSAVLSTQAAESGRDVLVLGLLPNCDALAHEARLDARVEIVCSLLPMSAEDYAALCTQADAAQAAGRTVWAVYERNTPFFSLEALGGTWQHMEEIARPDNLTALELYRMEARCASP